MLGYRARARARARVLWTLGVWCALALVVAQPACARDAVQDPYAALRAGEYEEAIRGLRQLARESDEFLVHRTLVDALLEVGRYEEAEEAARAAVGRAAVGAALSNALGEALYARGDVAGAEEAFRRSIDAGAPDAATARLNLAVLQFERGEIDEAMRGFDGFIDLYNQSARLGADGLTAVGTAVRYLGRGDPQLFHDAVKAYGEAQAAAEAQTGGRPASAFEPRLRMGDLFLEKYSSTDAQALFREVLAVNPRHPRALLGMAAAKYFDGTHESLEFIEQSLEVNPNLVAARVLNANLMLDLEDYEQAEAEARRALEVNPSSLEALTLLAGVQYLRGEDAAYEETRGRVLSINPEYADFYNTIAELAVRHRKYASAVELAKLAIRTDSLSWWGWGVLGLNQLRTGELAEARRNLEVAFGGDPFNVWIKNTLDLLDTFERYRVESTDRFEFMLHGDEAELLAPYIGELAEEAYTKLAERYGYRPATPVRVEVFPSHADFSVRTVGLAGLGALGVAFGNQLAMDSPAARERGEFNWGSTLWHEIAHAFTLGATDHHVPRWLTEGLSVLEERRARPGWGDDVSLDFLVAYKRGDLLPVSELNNGFVRPRFPNQVALSYYQASLVAEMIESEHGWEAVRRMLGAYREGRTDAEVVREVLRMEPDALDERFDAYVRQRFADALAAVPESAPIDTAEEPRRGGARSLVERLAGRGDDFISRIARGRQLIEEGNLDEAQAAFEQARDMIPEYGGPESPYGYLAAIHERKGDAPAAAAALEKLTLINENAYDANVKLAELREQAGDAAGAAAALERAIYIHPYDIELHDRLAELYSKLGEKQKVVRERRALVALAPVDRADALYRLALAYEDAGDLAAARREVLRALEIAPSFRDAQELLLRLRG